LDISLRNFRPVSLEPGDYEEDERLDRSVLMVALGVVSGGIAFLLGMVFLLFPEWIRPIAFGPGFSEPRTYAVLLRPVAAADKRWGKDTPLRQSQARNLLIDNLLVNRSVPFRATAQTPRASPTVSINPPASGPASAQATPASTGQAFGRGAGKTPNQPVVLPLASAQPGPAPNIGTRGQHGPSNAANPIVVPPAGARPASVPNTGTRGQQPQLNPANPGSAAAAHGGGRKLA
jgi:hypothetical protein